MSSDTVPFPAPWGHLAVKASVVAAACVGAGEDFGMAATSFGNSLARGSGTRAENESGSANTSVSSWRAVAIDDAQGTTAATMTTG